MVFDIVCLNLRCTFLGVAKAIEKNDFQSTVCAVYYVKLPLATCYLLDIK